jgi:hypothetical protein
VTPIGWTRRNPLLSVYSVGIPSGHNIYHGYDFLFIDNAGNDPISPDSEPIKPPQISGQRFYIFMVQGIFTFAQNQKLFPEPLPEFLSYLFGI